MCSQQLPPGRNPFAVKIIIIITITIIITSAELGLMWTT
jgi:hypothetical protein